MTDLGKLTTEARNSASLELDRLSSLELVELLNTQDAQVIAAVAAQKREIAQAIDAISARLQRGGRLIYCGAGTSGRLGVLDAAECPPTFNTDPSLVLGLIAGGPAALTRAVEGAEDHAEWGARDLQETRLTPQDTVIGIASSGRTPYVIGALQYARQVGAFAIGLVCNVGSEIAEIADLTIAPIVGPEVLAGSTRMKAGTATKLVLNAISTGTMVRLGKTYGNLMVDLRATNQKLAQRALRIVQLLTDLEPLAAEQLLADASGELKTAIVMHAASCGAAAARTRLLECQGQLRLALGK